MRHDDRPAGVPSVPMTPRTPATRQIALIAPAAPAALGLAAVAAVAMAMVLAVAVVAAPATAHAADKRVVAVLYFDNNTGDNAFDVFQKGFADMLITDLSAVDELVVVERDKLQKLLDEIQLQGQRYFDPATAVKLGKGLGARYAVTGAFVAVKPQVRIDVRMIDIATGQVVVATKVTGKTSALFDLEQQLVEQFVSGMKVEFDPPTRPQTRVPDVATLREYSEGIDLADRGQLEQASQKMAQVVKRAPTFALARLRRDEIVRRLEAAATRREDIITDSGVDLARNADDFLKRHALAKLSQDDAKVYLAYRFVRGQAILRALTEHLSTGTPNVILPGHTKQAVAQMKAYYGNQQLLIRELAEYDKRYRKVLPGGQSYLDTSFKLPPDDEQRARHTGMGASMPTDVSRVEHGLGEFLLLGTASYGSRNRVIAAPTLSDIEGKFAALGYGLLDDAWALADAHLKVNPRADFAAVAILETYADALLLRGKQEQGIAKLQEALDRYPTSSRFPYVERRIKQELGLAHDHTVKQLERYAKGLKGCDDMDLRVGLGGVMPRRVRTMGLRGVRVTVVEVEKACTGNDKAKRFWEYLYRSAALQGAEHADCAFFDEFMDRSIKAGGSKSDAAAYRKNYSKCP